MLLLADIFERFIITCLKYYNLDPTHYFSAPGLSWDAMLRKTNIELEKINNSDMHLFIEKGMRGGICYTAKKHSKANDLTDIKYYDMNNLYGKAMMSFYHMVDLDGLKLQINKLVKY